MERNRLLVLKFGSSVLRSHDDLPRVVNEIYRHVRAGRRVVAVVSAIGQRTDELMAASNELDPAADSEHVAALLATGEEASSALVALACERAGLPTARFDAESARLVSDGPLLDASPVGLDVEAFDSALEGHAVVVLPGFIGRSRCGRVSVFGRGGSDLTALFVAHRLQAGGCRLVKDVDGLYDRDPASPGPAPRRFAALPWSEAETLGGGIVQSKAVRFARDHRLSFELGAAGSDSPTRIGPDARVFALASRFVVPLRVALCGHGNVGQPLLRALRSRPSQFEVSGVLARNPRTHVERGLPADWLVGSIDDLMARPCDVLVELIGGTTDARSCVEQALDRGIDVVTANKASLAVFGRDWSRRARRTGARLLISASVGGSVPALETVNALKRRGRIRGFEGVLNGTANYLLDRFAEGATFDESLRAAQGLGLAEADPTLDIDGTDAAQKLELLARTAWGEDHDPIWVEQRGIGDLDPTSISRRRAEGHVTRLVASASWTPDGPTARIRPMTLAAEHPLAKTRGEENRLVVCLESGARVEVSGKGAGGWPTAESVLADLGDLWSAHSSTNVRADQEVVS